MIEELFQILVQISGPNFLWYFAGISIVCIVIGWKWKNADGSTQYDLPELTKFDPITIAALRGGTNAVIRTALFSLWNNNLIDFRNEGEDTEIFTLYSEYRAKLENIEEEIYRAVRAPTKTSHIFSDNNLKLRIEAYLQPIFTEMENLHLARTKDDRERIWRIFMVLAPVIAVVGGAKLYLDISRSQPVVFLIMLIVGSLIVLYASLSPYSHPTALGKRYLKALKEHFGWLGEAIKETRAPQGIDPALAIAIFGIGIIGTSNLHGPFKKAFTSTGGCGGGCGGCGGCAGCG